MEVIIIILSLFVISILIYGNSRLITLSKSNVYNENRYVQKLFKKQNQFLVAADILVTMFEFLISAIVVDLCLGSIETSLFISLYGRAPFVVIKYISILFITVISTYITMIIGIYIPKHIVHMRKKYKFNDSYIMYFYGFLNYLLYPISFLSTKLDTVIKSKVTNETDLDEIKEFTNKEVEKGSITKLEKEIMEKTVSNLDRNLCKVCTKMEDVKCINSNEKVVKIKEIFAKYPISRLIVYEKSRIIGYVHIKDILLNEKNLGLGKVKVEDIVRNVAYIDKDKTIEDALNKFKKEKCKMVVIKDNEVPYRYYNHGRYYK